MKCPHCLENFHDTWTEKYIGEDVDGHWGVNSTSCPACQKLVVGFGSGAMTLNPGGRIFRPGAMRLIRPKAISRAPIPPEVPEVFTADYAEACLVLGDSEKASAALSRRCLQNLLREKIGVKKGDLANEIQQVLDSKQLPSHLADDLDAIRNIGNFAAHPIKSSHTGEIVDVEPHEAEWSLDVLEGLFDFCFVQPARSKAKRDAMDAKLREAGKPPMKKS